ncbi:MAG TPA: hypothetical protein VGB72_03685 [Acidobacteriota bacterium]
MKKSILAILTILLFLAASSLPAQEAKKPPLREEIIKLNYADEDMVLRVLYSFLSPEGRINSHIYHMLVTLKDYPENVEKVLAFIKKIDVKPADLAFTVQLILASAADDIKTDEALAGDPILKELRSFLRYKNFALLDTSLVRAVDRQRSRITLGTKETEFVLILNPSYILEEKGDLLRVNVDLSQRTEFIKPEGGADRSVKSLIEGNLSLKPGERTVVGVSKMGGGDKGLILIISGKVVK